MVRELVESLEQHRPLVKIKLVTILTFFKALITPLEALRSPEPETGHSVHIASNINPTNIITACSRINSEFWNVMPHDANGMILEGIEKRLGVAVEIDIGIKVGYQVTVRYAGKDILNKSRAAGIVVFQLVALALNRQQLRIGSL